MFAHDPQTGESGARAVTAIWPHEDTLVEFEVGDATVTTTGGHEFWNVTDNAWQETQHIDAGDLLLTADGAMVEAGTLLWGTAHVAPAFDLTIDEIHTYHVTAGDESVLVHNNNCDFAVQDELRELQETRVAREVRPETHGPAESIAGIPDGNGGVLFSDARHNITNGNGPGFGVRQDLFDTLDAQVDLDDGVFSVPDPDSYFEALDEIYSDLGTPLNRR